MKLSELVQSSISCKKRLGGNPYLVIDDKTVMIYTYGGYSITTDGKTVCNKDNHKNYTVIADRECDISELLFHGDKEDKDMELLVKSSNLTLSNHVLERGKITKRANKDLKKYTDYLSWLEQNKRK